jgi:hypothetical protein
MARRNASQSNRRRQTNRGGRRISSGGFPTGNQPDVYPLVQQLAHSAQRYYANRDLGGGPGGRRTTPPFTGPQGVRPIGGVNPGGLRNGGGPTGIPDYNPGGLNQRTNPNPNQGWPSGWPNPGSPKWNNDPGFHIPGSDVWLNPGGLNQGGAHNHGGHQHDHPGGGPGHTHDGGGQGFGGWPGQDGGMRFPGGGGPNINNLGQNPMAGLNRGMNVNPGGPMQGGGGGGQQVGSRPNQGPPGGGGGQGQGQMPPWFQDWLASNPALAKLLHSHGQGQQQHQHQGGDQPHGHDQQGQGQGGGGQGGQQGGGGGGQGGGGGGQNVSGVSPALNPTPGTAPTGTPWAGINPTMGNNYGGTFQSIGSGQPWQSYSGPQPTGLAQGSFQNPEANDTERFTYDTFAGGQTYKPMPGPLGGQPGGNYPFQGYAPPPSNWHWYNPGTNGTFGGPGYQQMSWDQYAQAMAQPDIANDIQPYFRQNAAPPNAQNVWWANPVVTDPGYYDPWTELTNLRGHFGQTRPGNMAGDTALGLTGNPQGQLDYYRYLAHQAGIPGYAQLTGPLPVGYHSPNIGGTYGA